VAVGEQDLRLGPERLAALAAEAGVTLLGDNLFLGDGPERRRAFPPAAPARVGGQRVALIGLLDPELGDPSGQLEVTPPAEAARAALAALDPRPDRVVVLFHGSAEAAREQLAALGDQIDLILCGHDARRGAKPARVGRAHLVQALRDARALTQVSLRGGDAQVQQRSLDHFVPDDPSARARVDRYYEDVRGLPEQKRKPTHGGAYVGAESCRACHAEAYAVFAATKHHGAQARVQAQDPKRADLAECTRCHVTGFGYTSGFRDLQTTPHLGEVSCEACHGVGGEHVRRKLQGDTSVRGYGLLPGFPASWEPVCVSCHDPSNSPDFDFRAYLRKIKHWKDRGE
jgi:2',3'-cyclic-nucleotide 2'-phosphodiesterase (5'-nucleotidase family)